MNELLSSGVNNQDRTIRKITRASNQSLDYDTEGELSTTVEKEDCLVVFVSKVKNKRTGVPLVSTSGRHEEFDWYVLIVSTSYRITVIYYS